MFDMFFLYPESLKHSDIINAARLKAAETFDLIEDVARRDECLGVILVTTPDNRRISTYLMGIIQDFGMVLWADVTDINNVILYDVSLISDMVRHQLYVMDDGDEADLDKLHIYGGALARPRIYFAHPITLYLTPIEDIAVRMLRSKGYTVVNPSDADFQARFEAYKAEHPDNYMQFFVDECEKCDEVAFMCFPDEEGAEDVPQKTKRVGSGVALEVESFWKRGKRAWYIPVVRPQPLIPVSNWNHFTILDRDETIALLEAINPDYKNWNKK